MATRALLAKAAVAARRAPAPGPAGPDAGAEAGLASLLSALPHRRHVLPLAAHQAEATGLTRIDPLRHPPDLRLIERLGAGACLRLGLLPWRRAGAVTVVLSAHTGQVRAHRPLLEALFGPVRMAYCTEEALHAAITGAAGPALAYAAETQVPPLQSCRTLGSRSTLRRGIAVLVTLVALVALFPVTAGLVVLGWALATLALVSLLKAVSTMLALTRRRPAPPAPARPVPARLPVVSLLVPLYRERAVAAHLLERLAALNYPRDLLDICLILEDDDATTRAALDAADLRPGRLPPWLQVIEVPMGTLRTKPRALNYALNFAKGSILGVYDAEDAPASDQIRVVVQRFAERGQDVACLQGALDFYNHGSNWMARCFTLEYATWFRIVLPGMLRLGFAIPLGGTTLFLRRTAIEALGGWDAHNVTEDADLGLRLARMGYRTELVRTVTGEEANARLWPWIRQRSRWLKGYAVTWAVHMRDPAALWRDLGPWRFFGFQLLFLATLSQFALAPLLWSFWPVMVGMPHPLVEALPREAFHAMVALMLACEVVNIVSAMMAVRLAGKRRLMKWALTLPFYFPLATLAAYKGLAELVICPFYWDKTAHGVFKATAEEAEGAAAWEPN